MPLEGADSSAEVQNHETEIAEQAVAVETVDEVQESVRKAYDRVANPDKPAEEERPTVETPPPEPVLTSEQAKDLMAQVSRIPELEKRLRDEGGRYGALKQTIEQLQQRMATSTTATEAGVNATDAQELLKDLHDEFPELASKLQGAFSKVMSRGGSIDPETINKAVNERLAAERQAATEAAIQELSEAHPDWMQVRETPEFKEWKETLSPRARMRFEKSQDPHYVAEMLDQHKDWLSSRTKQTNSTAGNPASKTRLVNAVLPTNGTRPAPKGEPNHKESIRAGYERVAGARR